MRGKNEEERLAKIKRPGPLPKGEWLPTAIYLTFATQSVKETDKHNTSPWQQWHGQKQGTFRQTYGYILLGWALGYDPSHLITPDTATATVCLRAHTNPVWQKDTFNRQMSKSFIIAHTTSTTAFRENFKVCSKRKKWRKGIRGSYDMQCQTCDKRILIVVLDVGVTCCWNEME